MSTMDPTFPFPFEPYAIQETFMKELYFTIEESKLGIFESPTGTGKSLSICCGALQWYRDNKKRTIENIEKEISLIKEDLRVLTDSEDWLQAEYDKIKKNQAVVALQFKLDKLKKHEDLIIEMKNRVIKFKNNINHRMSENYFKFNNKIDKESEHNKENIPVEEEVEDDDLIVDYQDKKDDSDNDDIENDLKEENENINKIFVSSRTHSQLSQFIGEIKRTVFKEDTRVVTLASRQHYCINSDVTRLKNVNLINERCLDMQKSKTNATSVGDEGKVLKRTKTKSCSACPYYNQNNITKLKERMLVDIMDMEDLVKCGKELKACPYYASRMALDDAEVVLISHAGIVSSGARAGFSLNLKDNILILDEAHGLTAALENAYSAPVSEKQLSLVKTYLNFYITKYRVRLNSKNLLVLNQISFVVGKLLGILKPKATTGKQQSETNMYTIEDFVVKAEIDHINLRPLVEFCESTRLAPKLHGFSMRYSQQALEEQNKKVTVNTKSSFEKFIKNISSKPSISPIEEVKEEVKANPQTPTEGSAGSALYALLALLKALCGRSAFSRILKQGSTLDHLLLDASDRFADVVAQCRSVIVAGGTMEPINEFRELLIGNQPLDHRLNVLRCGHVVPPDNVLAVCLSKGPSNLALNFSYETRTSTELLNEVGRILRNVCSIVPGGIVCFLPSYSYEQTVYEHLKNNKFIEGISRKKTIFREPKSAAEVDQVLQRFATAVRNKDENRNGALLLSVVGGKLSEGLNFSDDLGRCVIVIGMPYPNIKSPELQEKMSYLNRKAGANAGNIYYENLCIKAVNQCIGRAVRHANDYACVLLVDERYSRPQTTAALPSFVQKSLITSCTFGQTIGSIARFFSKHKENKK